MPCAIFFLGGKKKTKKKPEKREMRDTVSSHFNNLILGKIDPPEKIISSQSSNSL